MDIVDDAQSAEALHLSLSIAKCRRSAPTIPACGRCHNCQASVPAGVLFCDADCRDDYQTRCRVSALCRRPL